MSTKIIAVANQKGGVGKTTTTLNLAAGLVKQGMKVLAIDLDPQANLTDYLGHIPDDKATIADLMIASVNSQPVHVRTAIRQNNEGIDYIASNILFSSAELFLSTAFCREQVLKKILTNDTLASYDYILIDCLPSLGILLTNALAASDFLIIPVQSQKFALDGVMQLEQIFHLVRDNINPKLAILGVLHTMCENTNMSKAVKAELERRYPDTVFETSISRSVEATDSSYKKKSLIDTHKSKLGAQYACVVNELLGRQTQ